MNRTYKAIWTVHDQLVPVFTPKLMLPPTQTGALAVAITLVKATQDGVITITVVAVAVHPLCEVTVTV